MSTGGIDIKPWGPAVQAALGTQGAPGVQGVQAGLASSDAIFPNARWRATDGAQVSTNTSVTIWLTPAERARKPSSRSAAAGIELMPRWSMVQAT